MIDFLLRHDKAHIYRFAPLQGKTAKEKLNPEFLDRMDTVVVLDDDKLFTKSDAVLHLFDHLGGPWRLLGVFRVLPKRFRDFVYDRIAAHRYAFFGKRPTCRLPTEGEKALFLD